MIWFSEREVIGSQRLGDFCWFLFFAGIEKNALTEHSEIATTIGNLSHPPSQTRSSLLAQLRIIGRSKIRTRLISGWGLMSR